MEILNQRVWEIENVWADVLEKEQRSIERHPTRMAKKLFKPADTE